MEIQILEGRCKNCPEQSVFYLFNREYKIVGINCHHYVKGQGCTEKGWSGCPELSRKTVMFDKHEEENEC